ncbi:MAG TPA: DUF1553 domain-containing protein [Bryobacteraceae bacterium]|nr:DUF1553 domain-containing protein [Bryobacteraceae bacterium]
MKRIRHLGIVSMVAAGVWGLGGLTPSRAQQPESEPQPELSVEHADCPFFGPERERFLPRIRMNSESMPGRITRQFRAAAPGLSPLQPRAAAFTDAAAGKANLIDQYIWQDLQANNITPAGMTTDYEFIRRATLDLTGRIPKADRVNSWTQSLDPNRRAALVDDLLAQPEWADKWTMFYGDLFRNAASAVQVQIRPEGRNAFYKFLHDSLAANKPYNNMATEMIAAQGTNTFDQANGQTNYLVLGVVSGGPAQDIYDGQTARIAQQFMGLAHVDCLLCHNGRGHLDSLSLWGSKSTRVQAWGLAAFLARTQVKQINTPQDPANPNARYNYFSLVPLTTDYNLNTTTGNRPARQPIGTVRTITPAWMFGGDAPGKGEDYRVALARYVTSDFQFSRAAVNYVWAQFFGRGIVDPPDQFDPARLDPDNPPADPWTLQPSNPRLLNALAQYFIDSNYDLKALMRLIVTSDTYQLASEYKGTWDPAWEKYFARHFVRRLWAEEVHDSIVTAIDTLPSYTVNGFSNASTVYGVDSPGFGKISFAMQAPDVINMPDGASSAFMDNFLRGNRDDQPRKSEGSVLQALALMNDTFVQNRIHATGTGATSSFLMKLLPLPDDQLINTLYIDVLSRYPTQAEKALALAQLTKPGTTTARRTNAEDILWTLFNKVDFVFNY